MMSERLKIMITEIKKDKFSITARIIIAILFITTAILWVTLFHCGACKEELRLLNIEVNGELVNKYQAHGLHLVIFTNGETLDEVFLSNDLTSQAEIGDDIIKHKDENKCVLMKSDGRAIKCEFYYEHPWCK